MGLKQGLRLKLDIGAMAPPLLEQLEEQGLEVVPPKGQTAGEVVMHLQRDIDALVRLHVRGLITDAEHHRVAKRIFVKIARVVRVKGETK